MENERKDATCDIRVSEIYNKGLGSKRTKFLLGLLKKR